ncbi:MAG: CotH kinase family protein [Lewinellaceae bacterium]|nr:CotH kinase family protein [Saprospiraceae bacterium]MCB9331526.1 CotH kinase family protein [Lewinellaceae bacterium]
MPKLYILLALFLTISCFSAAQKPLPEEQPLIVRFSLPGGFYNQKPEVSLSAGDATIYYTTDGSLPTIHSTRYTQPLRLEQTTVVRAIARRGKISGQAFARTYFVNEPVTNLPVISVAINPGILFHPERGIMMDGPDAKQNTMNKPGANFWTRREFACNVEIFESDKKCVHNSGSGFRLFGGYSRIYPQKSMVLVARSNYGKKFFRHRLFGADQPKKFKYLVLRNGGSDFDGAHFRDELMNRLTDGWDLEKQAFRPALVYLNGQYWGIYHIREKINARFLEDHADVDRDSLDLMEHMINVRHGSSRHYRRLLDYIRANDLSDPKHYIWVQGQMDVSNFIDYQVAQIYCDNTDAGGNIRYWRPKRAGGRWRWIMFDTDWGFGLYDPQAWQHDAIQFFTEPDGPRWPNPPWSTFLLRNLLRNKDFKRDFVNRLCDRLNTDFAAQKVLAEITWFEKTMGPDMPRHLQRWRLSSLVWERNLSVLREFAAKRPDFLRSCLTKNFDLGNTAGLQVAAAEGGTVLVNQCISVGAAGYTGTYFENMPVTLVAVPAYGYRFAGWEGIKRDGRTIFTYLKAGDTLQVKARFEPFVHELTDKVLFNEIDPAGHKTGDWVELYNASSKAVPMVGWRLADQRHEWVFPVVTIPPKGYLVVCQDTAAFRRKHPSVPLITGDFRFGFNKNAERLALYAADGSAVDSVSYLIDPPEGGFTLDLLMPDLNNSDPKNWAIHLGPGSAGGPNPLYMSKVLSEEKDRSLRVGLAIGLLVLLLGAVWLRQNLRGR